LSLELLNPSALENPDGFEQILAHRIGCQRAISPPVQQKGIPTAYEVYGEGPEKSTLVRVQFRFSAEILTTAANISTVRTEGCQEQNERG
jgi:hypothetical protein